MIISASCPGRACAHFLEFFLKHTLSRLGAACALTAFAVGAAAPAFAATPPRIEVDTWSQVNVTPGQTESGDPRLNFSAEGSGTVTGLVMTIDLTKAAGLAEIKADACDRSGALLTCAIGDFAYAEGETPYIGTPTLEVTGLDGANGIAKLPVTLKADNASTANGTFTVRVAEDVKFAYQEVDNHGAPGDTIDLKIPVGNAGSTPIYNPRFVMEVDGATPVEVPANCESHNKPDAYSAWLDCRFEGVLQPGQSATVSFPWKIRADVLGPISSYVSWDGNRGEAPTGTGSGPVLTIPDAGKAPAEVPVQFSFDRGSYPYGDIITLTSGGKTDLAAVSSTLPAKTGETTLTVGVRNDGPAQVWPGRAGDPRTYVWVKLPQGVEPVSLPEGCSKPNKGDWGHDTFPGDFRCSRFPTEIPVGETMSFAIPVKVTDVDLDAEGVVTVARDFGGERQERIDLDAKTDTTVIAFEGGTGGGTGGGLADTGTTAGVVAATGAVIAVAGFVAFRIFRRRANASGYYGE